jgi:tetratricopeptide (TPR) repeat protein
MLRCITKSFETAKDLTEKRTAGKQVPIFKGSLSTPFVFQAVGPKGLVDRVSPILERFRSDRVSMTKQDADETYRVSRILEKARAMSADDARLLSALANLAMRTAHYDDALTLVQESIDLFEVKAQSESPTDKENSEWRIELHDAYILQAQALIESGRFKDALVALKSAQAFMPKSPRALAIEGEVNVASGDANQAAKSFDALMLKERILVNKIQDLPDEELGRAIIWHALALYESGDKARSTQLLRDYGTHEPGNRVFINLLSIFTVGIVPWESGLGTEATWSKRVARFLIGNRSEGDLFTFLRENQDLDEGSFNCQAHFYAGYFAMMNKKMELAVSHFHDAVATEQRQYPEYWVAKKKLAELAILSWR